MEDDKNISKGPEKRWCILSHPDSDLIGDIFSGKRKVYNPEEDSTRPLPPFEHFIPFSDLKGKPKENTPQEDDYKSYDAMLDERALRSDLHRYIFICEPKEVVKQILMSSWNRSLTHRLFVFRDETGDPIEITNTEMERFKTVIKRYDFQIVNGDPTEEVREGDPVFIVSGPMEGSDGVVTEIREKGGEMTLTIEFSMFQDKMRILVPGISIADVRLKTQGAQQLLQDPVITHFEDELIELLCHLHGKNGSKQLNKDDQKRLKFLYQYSDIVFEDNPDSRAKFAALMLICAYLMNDKPAIEQRLTAVESLLSPSAASAVASPSAPAASFSAGCGFAAASASSASSAATAPSAPAAASRPSAAPAAASRPSAASAAASRPSAAPAAASRPSAASAAASAAASRPSAAPAAAAPSSPAAASASSPSPSSFAAFPTQPSALSFLDCYLLTALFIVTHDPSLRRITKTWRQSHPDCPLSLRRFQSIAKQIRC